MCDRWRFGDGKKSGFECFYEDVGEPPTSTHSLDRIYVDGEYGPSNVKWSTPSEQANNRRSDLFKGVGRLFELSSGRIIYSNILTPLTEMEIKEMNFA